MAYILGQFKVRDYARWRKVFDEKRELRSKYGSTGSEVFQSIDDANEVFVLIKGDSEERARDFLGSDDLRQAMQQAGVTGKPAFHVLEEKGKTEA